MQECQVGASYRPAKNSRARDVIAQPIQTASEVERHQENGAGLNLVNYLGLGRIQTDESVQYNKTLQLVEDNGWTRCGLSVAATQNAAATAAAAADH